jgi:iron complex outermembrane receptor protein
VEADLGEHVVARVRYSKFDWDDSYGVGNTLFNVISPIDTTSFTGAGTQALYYNPAFGYTGTNPAVKDPYRTNTNDTATGKLSDHHRLQTDVTWDLGGATLKYLGGFQTYVYDTTGDADQTPRTAPQSILVPASPVGPFTATNVATDARTFYQERQKWFSNEVNLSSNGDGAVQWIVGLFQYHQTYDQPQGIRVVGDPSIYTPLTLAGTPSDPNPRGAYLYVDGHLNSDSYAGFGQVDWKFAPDWKITAGLRYTRDEKTGYDIARYVARLPSLAVALAAGTPNPVAAVNATQAFSVDITTLQVCGTTTLAACANNPATANLFANPGGGLRRNLSGDWDALTGTLGIQWEPDSDTNVYARYSRGYKSGGWLGSNGLTPDPYADPEHVNAYELGVKKNIGRTLQANASLYYDDYKGFQTPLTVPLGTITASQFLNLNARIWGFEFEGQWAPIDHLQLYASYA